MKNNFQKILCILISLVLLVAVVPADLAFGVLSEVSAPSHVKSFKSSNNFEKENLNAYISEDNVLEINYKTKLPSYLFKLSLYRIGAEKGDINLGIIVEPVISYASDGTQLFGFSYNIDFEQYNIPDGYYNLYIKRATSEENAQKRLFYLNGLLYKNMEIRVKGGEVSIPRFNDVLNYNKEIQGIGKNFSLQYYLDNTLSDIDFVLRDPVSREYATMTQDKISFIKSISDKVVSGCISNYEKLEKIYEYTASNFYYDSVAFQTHSLQYSDPYENIRNFEYGLSSINSISGRVFTTCQGYSAIFVALARAQGIPARFAFGHRLAIPSNDWITEDNIDVRDHWWAEAYVNNRWIYVDATTGTTNKYNKNTGEWTVRGLTNYTFFDPSPEQIATSTVYMGIYPDFRYGKWIDNESEKEQIRVFLDQGENNESYSFYNKTNGQLLNSNYSPSDIETWSTGIRSHFMSDGKGNTAQIKWSDKGLTGSLNLNNFKYMTYISASKNNLTSVNLDGCSALSKVYLYDNKLSSVSMKNCSKLSYVRVQRNPIKNLLIYVNGSNRSFASNENGSFYFTLDTSYKNSSFSLYSVPNIGYKLGGIYSTASGNLISRKETYHFTPKAYGYELRFVLNPDSYRYYLSDESMADFKLSYVRAVAKRLYALGYYNGSFNSSSEAVKIGLETSYTPEIKDAVTKFQIMHDIADIGDVGKKTWSALFSNNAKPMVSDSEYQQVLEDYQKRKEERLIASQKLPLIKLKASTTAGKEAMKICWKPLDDTSKQLIEQYADGIEVYRSLKKVGGYSEIVAMQSVFEYEDSGLKKSTRYYYKVRPYKIIGDKKIYGSWSNITYRFTL